MTWNLKKQQEPTASGVELFWDRYGTWIVGALVVVLAGVLISQYLSRHYEKRAVEGMGELEKVGLDDPNAEATLQRLAKDYGNTRIAPAIQLRHAQVLYRLREFADARKILNALEGERRLSPVDRAQIHLTLAYVAQELGEIDEARKCFGVVETDGLYAAEAKRMLGVLARSTPEKPAAIVAPANAN